MRIESVTAHAFGPLTGQTLELAEGLTIVFGPNESAKSSWHAALFAGLCGMRRVRGGKSSEDVSFAERHRPWIGEAWSVEVDVELGPSCVWVAANPPRRCYDSKFCPGGGNEICLTASSHPSCAPRCKCACDR